MAPHHLPTMPLIDLDRIEYPDLAKGYLEGIALTKNATFQAAQAHDLIQAKIQSDAPLFELFGLIGAFTEFDTVKGQALQWAPDTIHFSAATPCLYALSEAYSQPAALWQMATLLKHHFMIIPQAFDCIDPTLQGADLILTQMNAQTTDKASTQSRRALIISLDTDEQFNAKVAARYLSQALRDRSLLRPAPLMMDSAAFFSAQEAFVLQSALSAASEEKKSVPLTGRKPLAL